MEAVAVAACPKCGATRGADDTACSKCGLAVSRMAAFAKEREDVPEVVKVAWEKVVAEWSEPKAHDELLRLAHTHEAYPWVAARYRTRAGDPVGDAQLERLRKATEITLYAAAAKRPENTKSRYYGLVAIVAMIILASILLYVVIRMRQGPEASPPVIEQR